MASGSPFLKKTSLSQFTPHWGELGQQSNTYKKLVFKLWCVLGHCWGELGQIYIFKKPQKQKEELYRVSGKTYYPTVTSLVSQIIY